MKSARTSVAEANIHDVDSRQSLMTRLQIILSVGMNIQDDKARNAQLISNVALANEMILLLERNTDKFKRLFPNSDELRTFIQTILPSFPHDDSSKKNRFITALLTVALSEQHINRIFGTVEDIDSFITYIKKYADVQETDAILFKKQIMTSAKSSPSHRERVGEAEVRKYSRELAMLKRDTTHMLFALNTKTLKYIAVRCAPDDFSKDKAEKISDDIFLNPKPGK